MPHKTALFVITLGFLIEGSAAPATLTWDGSSSTLMNTAANWSPEQIPNSDGENDNLIFPMGMPTSVTNNIPGTLLIGNISIASDYTIGGNAFGINAATTSYLGSYTLTFSSTDANINVPVNLNGTWAVTSTADDGNAINGIINGNTTGNLNLLNGVLKLGASNTYNGVLTVGNEIPLMGKPTAYLQATAANAFGNAGFNTVVTVASTATLDLNNFSSGLGTLSGPAGSLVKLGAGTLSVNSGSAQVPFYGVIAGAGGNVIVNTNGLALMGDNTYSGSTTIQQGGHLACLDFDLGMTSGVTFGSGGGALVVGQSGTSGKDYTFNAAGTIGVPGSYTLTLNGIFSGNSSFIKDGPGTLVFKGTNNNIGDIHLWGGTLNIESLGSATGFTFDSPSSGIGTLQFGFAPISAIALPFDFALPGVIDTNGHDITINAAITGGHYIVKTGPGKLTLPYVGNIIDAKVKISEGILNVTYDGYHTATQTVFSGLGTGTLQIGESFTVAGNKPFAMPIVFMADGTIDTQAFEMDSTDVIAGQSTYTFNKVGSGVLTLGGANIYQCPTHVMAGTLKAGIATGNSGAFGVGSAITIDAGATLDFSTFANSVASLDNAGTISTKATVTATSTSTAFTQAGAGTLLLDFPNSSGTPYGNIVAAGGISLDGTLTVTNSGSYTPPSTVKEILLLQSTGSGKRLSGQFATISPLPSQFASIGKVQYDYSDNQVYIGLASGCNGDWTSISSGNWANTANWDGACAPGVGSEAEDHDSAIFSDVVDGAVTVTLATSDGASPQSVTLHNISLESTATAYTIQQFNSSSQIILDKSSTSSTKALISMSGASATINAPIVLNTDSRISLSSGTLTLGASSSVTGTASTLYISEGATSGTLVSGGSISPMAVNIEGGTIQNNGTVLPSGALTIAGISGIASPLSLTNTSTMTAGTTLTIGGAGGGTAIINTGTINSNGAFLMSSGTLSNNSGGHVNAALGQILTLSGGTITNNNGAFLGLSTSNLALSGGTLNSSDVVLANNYSQGSTSTLQLNFPTNAETPRGNISAAGAISLGGTLSVLNTGSFIPPDTGEIVLLSSSGSGKKLSGKFSSTNLAPSFSQGTITYDYSENTTYLTLSSCNGVWQSTSAGNWGNSANWVGGCAPGVGSTASDHDLAQFNNVAAGSIAVTLANTGGGSAQTVTLHDIVLDASSTQFTIQQFDATSQIILDTTMGLSKPRISALAGSSTINAPIVLNADSRIYLGGGALTLGPSATVTSASSTLYISEGAVSSTLTNNGSITPTNLIIEGGIINNNHEIHPTGALTISGLEGISAALVVTNNNSMIAGTTFTIGGTVGGATIANNGTMRATGPFLIQSDTLTNNTGGTLGISTSPLTLSGGTLITSGEVFASTYTQSGSGTLQFNVTSASLLSASGQANLGSSPVIVNAFGNVSAAPTQITLLTAEGGVVGKFGSTTFMNFPPNLIPNLIYPGNSVVLDMQKSVPSHFSSTSSQVMFTAIAQHNSLISRKAFQMKRRMPKPISPIALVANSIPQEELLVQNEDLLANSEGLLAQQAPVRKSENLSSRISQTKQQDTWNVYIGPVASFGHVDTLEDQIGFGYGSAGALAGFDTILPTSEYSHFNNGIGSVIEYRHIWGTAAGNAGNFTSDKLHGSVYGTLVPKAAPAFLFDWILGFAYTWDNLSRTVGPDHFFETNGATNELIGTGFIGGEYTFSTKVFSFTPLLHLQYAYDHINGFTEKGAGIYDLRIKDQNLQSLATSLGARVDATYTSSSMDFVLEIDAEWVREYLNESRSVYFTPFTITSIPTVVSTAAAPRNSGLVALDLLATFPGMWQVEANSTLFFNKVGYDAFFFLTLGKLF